jgi:AcrR family transcriptional regulator
MTMAESGHAPSSRQPVTLLWASLPPPPPAPLDAYLDAAARCFARHGVGRTSLPDIARELGVSRTTVYRRAGTIERLASLLLARELHALLATLPDILDGVQGPRTLTHLLAGVVQFCREHPIVAKVLDDEPELIGAFLEQQLPSVIERVCLASEPLLAVAMDVGLIRRCHPSALAELLVRVLVTCIIAPPVSDVGAFLEQTLVPLLEP